VHGAGHEVDNEEVEAHRKRRDAAVRLQKTLDQIASNTILKAKERRSAKRRAEAIASEEASLSAAELLDWYHQHQRHDVASEADDDDDDDGGESQGTNKNSKKKKNPYVAFVGQLSYETTAEALFGHFRKHLGDDAVTPETLKIRLLTRKKPQGGDNKNGDSKDDGGGGSTKKTASSRGMAFVEASTPELLYSLLSLHHTALDGRRINVERTAGGRNADKRRARIHEMRQDQQLHQRELIRSILREHGLLRNADDDDDSRDSGVAILDDGAVQLCEKHAASAVQAALDRFAETNGLEKDNPCAYLTFLLTQNQNQEDERKDSKAPNPQNKHHRPLHNSDHPSGVETQQQKKKRRTSCRD
jgi:RNA recognition motif-containing protein